MDICRVILKPSTRKSSLYEGGGNDQKRNPRIRRESLIVRRGEIEERWISFDRQGKRYRNVEISCAYINIYNMIDDDVTQDFFFFTLTSQSIKECFYF